MTLSIRKKMEQLAGCPEHGTFTEACDDCERGKEDTRAAFELGIQVGISESHQSLLNFYSQSGKDYALSAAGIVNQLAAHSIAEKVLND